MENTEKCKDRVRAELRGRIEDLDKLWTLYQAGNDESDPDLGRMEEYGLAFDYVAPGTFPNQTRGYFRYQLSWGGPSDEFRFFADENMNPTRIEYWFMDWFDGAKVTLRPGSRDYSLVNDIWEWFKEAGSVQAAFEAAKD